MSFYAGQSEAGVAEIVKSGLLLFIMIITGAISSLTDLRGRKIYNRYLIMAGGGVIFIHCVFFIFWHIPFYLEMFSFLAALVVGGWMYFEEQWKPGDAKLFMLFALLMPVTGYESSLFFPSLVLFVCSFLLSFFCLLPMLLVNFFQEFKRKKRTVVDVYELVLGSFLIMLCLSWVVGVFQRVLPVKLGPVLSAFVLYFSYSSLFFLIGYVNKFPFFWGLSLFLGFAIHYFLVPSFFQMGTMIVFIKRILFFSLLAAIVKVVMKSTESGVEYKQRVSFAPFLFCGCWMSYTPILGHVMKLFSILKG